MYFHNFMFSSLKGFDLCFLGCHPSPGDRPLHLDQEALEAHGNLWALEDQPHLKETTSLSHHDPRSSSTSITDLGRSLYLVHQGILVILCVPCILSVLVAHRGLCAHNLQEDHKGLRGNKQIINEIGFFLFS